MIELTYLALLNWLTNWGRNPVLATRVIPADAAEVLALVSDPAGQELLLGALGMHLRIRADVEPSRSQRIVSIRLTRGRRDLLWITWIVVPGRGTTEVELAAQLESHAVLVRLLMVLGGNRRLHRHLERTLGTLAAVAHRAAEHLDDAETPARAPRTPTLI